MAFLLTEPQQLLFSDPTFARLLRGAADAMAQQGQTLIMLVAGTAAEREHVMSYLTAGHVVGARVSDLDAVFAANDLMATGALRTLRAAGWRVPRMFAVAGFDDSGAAAESIPPLTTMWQPFDAISAEMVSVLLGMVGGGQPKFVTMPAELVVREST